MKISGGDDLVAEVLDVVFVQCGDLVAPQRLLGERAALALAQHRRPATTPAAALQREDSRGVRVPDACS